MNRFGLIKQRGVALITALLILAIAMTATAYLVQQEHMSIRRSGNVINGNKTYLYAIGGEKIAMNVLEQDLHDPNFPELDKLDDIWNNSVAFDIEDNSGTLVGRMSDLQGKFNINNLLQNDLITIDNVALERFTRLLRMFNMDIAYADAVIDWIDRDDNATGSGGAEDNYYLGLEHPYRTANRAIASISELKLIRGIGADENLPQLIKHLTALPEHTPINVNTADSVVLDAVNSATPNPANLPDPNQPAGMDDELVVPTQDGDTTTVQVAQKQQDKIDPYTTTGDYENRNNLKDGENGYTSQDLSVKSFYFLVEIVAEIDRGRTVLKSVIQRDNNGKMRVVMRSQGDL